MHPLIPLILTLALLAQATAPWAGARLENWTGADGKSFRGEPAAIYGPLAVFKTGAKSSLRLPLGALSPADCLRFQAGLDALPARAASWAAAKSALTRDLVGGLRRLDGNELERFDFAATPEPEIVVLCFASNNDGASWAALNAVNAAYPDLKKNAGDFLEVVFFGVGHNAEQHRSMAAQTKIVFPLTDFHAQQQMPQVKDFAPGKAPYLVAVTRHGVLLQAAAGDKYEHFAKFMSDLSRLVSAHDPNNPAGWSDRLRYLRTVKPARFQNDRCGPEMLGHPLNLEVLRRNGVRRITAQFEIDADGAVSAVHVARDEVIDADLAAILESALARSPFIPAIDHGRFVAGPYAYAIDIAP